MPVWVKIHVRSRNKWHLFRNNMPLIFNNMPLIFNNVPLLSNKRTLLRNNLVLRTDFDWQVVFLIPKQVVSKCLISPVNPSRSPVITRISEKSSLPSSLPYLSRNLSWISPVKVIIIHNSVREGWRERYGRDMGEIRKISPVLNSPWILGWRQMTGEMSQ